MGKRIGIDLGTTYSCVSYVDDAGVVRIIDNYETSKYTTPSIVFFKPDFKVVVGETARAEGALCPDRMVERVKSFMGNPDYTINVEDKEFSAAAIAKFVLEKLYADAKRHLGEEEIEGAIVTCPAYFGNHQRVATREAAVQAGINVIEIMNEPEAAAFAYSNSKHEDMKKRILVYDLGGGTFDCTIMDLDFTADVRKTTEITTDGNHRLGGKNWDDELARYVKTEFCTRTGHTIEEMDEDGECRQWFSENIEELKIRLTNLESSFVIVRFGGDTEKIEVTREKFEELTRPLLDETKDLIDKILAEKNIDVNSIDEILLVGSSTIMPQVSAMLEAAYSRPLVSFEPGKAVAMGAALMAHYKYQRGADSAEGDACLPGAENADFTGDDGTAVVINRICTKSYGLLSSRGGVDLVGNIIKKDDAKPACKERTFATSCANQSSIKLLVYENDNREDDATVEESRLQYEECTVQLTPNLPNRAPIKITFNLDISGILEITALDITNNVEVVVKPVLLGNESLMKGMDEVYTLGE